MLSSWVEIARRIFTTLTAVAVITAAVWIFAPQWVDGLDSEINKSITGYYTDKAEVLAEQVRNNPTPETLNSFSRELARLRKVLPGDKLFDFKRAMFAQLVHGYKQAGLTEAALDATEEWMSWRETNYHDLLAATHASELMMRVPERAEEGNQLAQYLFDLLPSSGFVAKHYYQYISSKKPTGELARFTWEHLNAVRRLHWEIFWDTGAGFNIAQSALIDPTWESGSQVNLAFDIPPNTIQVRVDPPSQIILSSMRFKISPDNVTTSLFEASPMMFGLSCDADVCYVSAPEGPHLYWPINAVSVNRHIEFSAVVDSVMSLTLLERFRVYNSPNEIVSVESKSWQIFWDVGHGFNEEDSTQLKTPANTNNVGFSLDIPPSTQRLRIDPPANLNIRDMKYRQSQGRWVGFPDLNLSAHSFSCSDSTCTSGKDDPYFFFNIRAQDTHSTFSFSASTRSISASKGSILRSDYLNALAGSQQYFLSYINGIRLHDASLELFWSVPGHSFSAARSVSAPMVIQTTGSGTTFAANAHLPALLTDLRVDFAHIEDITYDIDILTLDHSRGTYSRLGDDLEPVVVHSLQKHGSSFSVTGSDPYFSVRVADTSVRGRVLSIKGTIR